MSRKLSFAFICDNCNKVIRDRLFKHTTKKGVKKHFCSQKCLVKQMNKFSLNDEQTLQFIINSNEIEEIYYDNGHYERGVTNKKHQIPEINGQLQALKFLTNLSIQKKLNTETICKLHKILMRDLLGPLEHDIRKCLVRVGHRLCPYPVDIKPMLETWCKKVNTFENPTEDDVWQAHLAYEYIHPFIDGNGRSGRLVWLWLRFKHGFGYGYVESETKQELYYPQFDNFNWEKWIS